MKRELVHTNDLPHLDFFYPDERKEETFQLTEKKQICLKIVSRMKRSEELNKCSMTIFKSVT